MFNKVKPVTGSFFKLIRIVRCKCPEKSEVPAFFPFTSWYQRFVHISSSCSYLWEKDLKGGFGRKNHGSSRTQLIRDGLKELWKVIKLWKEEVKENFESDPVLIYRPGMRFGQLQTKLGIAVLLHHYKFSPCEKTERKVVLNPKAIFTASVGGNWLQVSHRH